MSENVSPRQIMKTSSSSTLSSDSSAIIEPLHNPAQQAVLIPKSEGPVEKGTGPMGLHAKGFYLKKMAATKSFVSPSDLMVSPCTQKLAQSKQRHYAKGKPLSLSSTFQASKLGTSSSGPLKPSSSINSNPSGPSLFGPSVKSKLSQVKANDSSSSLE